MQAVNGRKKGVIKMIDNVKKIEQALHEDKELAKTQELDLDLFASRQGAHSLITVQQVGPDGQLRSQSVQCFRRLFPERTAFRKEIINRLFLLFL